MAATHTPHFVRVHFSASSSDISLSGEIGAHRNSSVSDCLSEVDLESGALDMEVDLESGALDMEVHLDNKTQRDCRICHLGLETSEQECGGAIELGCSCKGDLGAAHKKCAETWFKIKGNTTCEICGATALGVAGEQTNVAHNASAAVLPAPAGPLILVETQTFWHSRRIMNFLLACMVVAFVISWLFHFKILS